MTHFDALWKKVVSFIRRIFSDWPRTERKLRRAESKSLPNSKLVAGCAKIGHEEDGYSQKLVMISEVMPSIWRSTKLRGMPRKH